MLAKDIMTTEVVKVHPGDTVDEVIKLLLDNRISGIPVVDDDDIVVGVVTEADLLVRSQKLHVPSYIQILGGIIYLDDPGDLKEELRKLAAVKVEDMMTANPVTVEEDTLVDEIATIMSDEGINRIPVVRNERIVGIVSRADIIRSLARKGQ
jgi:CBS domain-containing protein